MPPLTQWFGSFALPSLAAILVTYLVLRFVEGRRIAGDCERDPEREPLTTAGKVAFGGIVATAVVLVTMSALDVELGLPTAIAGAVTTLIVCAIARRSPLEPVKCVSWSVLPLVAGLFVLVEALGKTGVIARIATVLQGAAAHPVEAAAASGTILAFVSNAVNNLPAGLVAADAVAAAHPPRIVVDALLIGVDLGPNLSITGSLATILWLQAIRREGEDVGFWDFLKVGAATMIPALVAALGLRLLLS